MHGWSTGICTGSDERIFDRTAIPGLDRMRNVHYNAESVRDFRREDIGMKKMISLAVWLAVMALAVCAQAEAPDGAGVGSTVVFGSYEQGEGQVPI